MTLIQSQQSKSRVCLSRLSAHLVAATLLLGGVQTTWGQDASESRWSTSNPPTPAMVQTQQKPEDNGLRRLPPIDQEVTAEPKPSSVTPSEKPVDKPQIAAQPQPSAAEAEKADPVNWSSPNVVIGPEISSRTVSHEEVVTVPTPQSKPSRYSSAPEITQTAAAPKGQSRFTQAAPSVSETPEKEKEEVAPEARKPVEPVFARVFDEETDSPGISQPEVATIDPSLSPIFACRLLGLRAIKTDETTTR